jgi:co-chaperonin GroES (HSP10)
MSMLKIRGARVAVTETQETFTSSIAMPIERNVAYNVGMVHRVGDGQLPRYTVTDKPGQVLMFLKENDIVLFQMNSIQAANSIFAVDGVTFFIVNQGDIIARLKSTTISLDAVEMLGVWVLVQPFLTKLESGLILPNTAQLAMTELQRYRLVQQGSQAGIDAAVGQEVLVERQLVHQINVGSEPYGFLSADRVYGVVG